MYVVLCDRRRPVHFRYIPLASEVVRRCKMSRRANRRHRAVPSLDHLIGSGKQGGRHRNAQSASGLQIDPYPVARRLLDGQIGGFAAMDDLVDQGRPLPTELDEIRTEADQFSRFDSLLEAAAGG